MLAPLTPDDLLRFALPTELALAPDGRQVVFVLVTQDAVEDQRHSALWRIALDDAEAMVRPFTSGQHRDRHPAWSPDGQWIAFISDREQGPQVWIIPSQGGEARRVTRMRHGAAHPQWSPDGTTILFVAEARAGEDATQPPENAEQQAKRDARRLRHVTRLQYRWDGDEISEGRAHLWTVDISPNMRIGLGEQPSVWATPNQITNGDFDHAEAAWSPDGARIAFISDRAVDRDANRTDALWVLTLADGICTQISTIPSENHHPAWDPDGHSVAWYGAEVIPDASHSNTHLWRAALGDDGTWHAADLLAGQDVNVGHGINGDMGGLGTSPPVWSADGAALYVTVCARGTSNLHRVALAGGAITPVTQGEYQVGPFAATPDGCALIAITATTQRPADLALFEVSAAPTTEPARWLTETNAWLHERLIVPPQSFTYTAPDGWELQGWLLLPSAAPDAPPQRWPAILQIHGGPHGSYGPTFYTMMQNFVGAGYAVVYVNPRGSIGYGETFARACDRDWGGKDYDDIMAGLEAAIAQGQIDPDRLAVTGASYGGYMTNWIIGHTERFKAAVTINSVSNLISSFGTSDVDSIFGVVEQGGTPWERRDFYLERSPVTYAPQITTPTRVIGAERDWRCPIEQSEQMFTAIKLLGRTATDFIRVPSTSHSIGTGSPQQRVDQRRAILEWIQRYLPTTQTDDQRNGE